VAYFAVTQVHGGGWDASLALRDQKQWAEHAAFMNELEAEGFVVLGGPLGDGDQVLLIFDAEDEQQIASRLNDDPWKLLDLLRIAKIEPWQVLLDSRRP
jgi:uncharacterized protein YciI